MLSADAIVKLHDELTAAWHDAGRKPAPKPRQPAEPDGLARVARQHRANFDLWHIEDEARAPGATDAELAEVKRRIDSTNQLRNDLAEELDHALLDWLAPQGFPAGRPAALRVARPDDRPAFDPGAEDLPHPRRSRPHRRSPDHTERNRDRLAILTEQRTDLAHCLDALWRETLPGERRFKLYRQLKMYNDPSLNPAIYRNSPAGTPPLTHPYATAH